MARKKKVQIQFDDEDSVSSSLDAKVGRILAMLPSHLPVPNKRTMAYSKLDLFEKDILFLEWEGDGMLVEICSDKVDESFFTLYVGFDDPNLPFLYQEIRLTSPLPESAIKALSLFRTRQILPGLDRTDLNTP